MSAPGHHLGLRDDRLRSIGGDRHQRPAGRSPQQVLRAELEPAASNHVAGPIARVGQRREVVGGDVGDVPDHLAGERLLRIDPRAVLARLGPDGAVRADDSAARAERPVEPQRPVLAELREHDGWAPADQPPVTPVDHGQLAFQAHLAEPIGRDGKLDRDRDGRDRPRQHGIRIRGRGRFRAGLRRGRGYARTGRLTAAVWVSAPDSPRVAVPAEARRCAVRRSSPRARPRRPSRRRRRAAR